MDEVKNKNEHRKKKNNYITRLRGLQAQQLEILRQTLALHPKGIPKDYREIDYTNIVGLPSKLPELDVKIEMNKLEAIYMNCIQTRSPYRLCNINIQRI